MNNDKRIKCPSCDEATMELIQEHGNGRGELWQCQNEHCQLIEEY